MLVAEGAFYGVEFLELDDFGIRSHFFDLFTVFDVDVGGGVFLVVFDGEAVARRRALAAEALHFGADDVYAHGAHGFVVRDCFAVACDDDFGEFLDAYFVHRVEFPL